MKQQKIVRSMMMLVVLGSSVMLVPAAYAQTPTPTQSHGNFFGGFLDFFAQKFGIDKAQVQSAAKEYRAKVKATITPHPTLTVQALEDREKARLDKLVTAGKITAAQETAILSELTSIRAKYGPEVMKNMTADQRKANLQAMQNELKAWATAQHINLAYVMPDVRIEKRGDRMMYRQGKRMNPSITPAPTQ
jgi:hypothetical protein